MKNKKSGKYKQRRKCGTKIRHHKNKVYEESKEEQMEQKNLKRPKKSGRGKNHMKVTKEKYRKKKKKFKERTWKRKEWEADKKRGEVKEKDE